jgi:phenylacetate-CoA ligase
MSFGDITRAQPPVQASAEPRGTSATIRGWLFYAIQKLRRSRSLDLLSQIERTPRLGRDQVEEIQWQRLSALLDHAEKNVPYYREMFRSLGIQSRDVRDMNDFRNLPILTKDIIRERQKDLIRNDVPVDSLYKHHSGGSTGVPLTFYRERSYVDVAEAGTFRNWMQCRWQPGEMVAFFWGGDKRFYEMPKWQFRLRQHIRRIYQFDPFFSGPQEMDEWLRIWPSVGARIAHGYASTIARFCEHIEKTGKSVTPLRGVFTTAEKLFPAQRDTISRVLGCNVYDCYGSSEVQNIAAECRHGRMHVNADFVVLESEQASPGIDYQAKPFLVTSLWNYAMPFIRYRNEDCGSLIEGDCDCGNSFALMELNISRVSDNFVLPNGRVVHGEFFTHLMYGSEGISTFQFHQTATDHITIWVVPGVGSAEARQRTLHSAVAQITALSPEKLTVEVRETDNIPLSSAGKHRFTRSDVG